MIQVICKMCKQELTAQGALIFTPPFGGRVTRWHICKACFRVLKGFVQGVVVHGMRRERGAEWVYNKNWSKQLYYGKR